ncbi:MAG: metal-dependent transcriptional regulator [Lachnospiraceae bacterium]|nr:metal-dependent transcriptional regulator [Lachnospiraceae bacterium]
MKLGESMEDYLESILALYQEKGYVRSVDVARYMNFSKPSVSHAVKELRKKGYLEMDQDGFLHLTDEGTAMAKRVYERHQFLTDMLAGMGVSREVAEEDACRIEHVISEESFEKMKNRYVLEQ